MYRTNIDSYCLRTYTNTTAGADDGIEEIRASGMLLQCFQTVTGVKFVVTVAVADQWNINDALLSSTVRDALKEIYVLYTECVLKDPFYELEMPIRSDLFVQGVDLLMQQKYASLVQKIVSTPIHTATTTSSTVGTSGANNTTMSSSSKLLYWKESDIYIVGHCLTYQHLTRPTAVSFYVVFTKQNV